jgi:hypothetical protein
MLLNPLLYGRGVISLAFFKAVPNKNVSVLKFEKYVFLGKCICYHLSLGDFIEKCLFHTDFLAFLGLTQKCGECYRPP